MNNKKVAIYTTPTCVYCQMTKDFFKQNDINFEEHNVQSDAVRRQEMVDKSGQLGVPVITVSDGGKESVVVGFDESQLSMLLGL